MGEEKKATVMTSTKRHTDLKIEGRAVSREMLGMWH